MSKTNESDGYKDETKVSRINFIGEAVNDVAVLVTAILTMSLSIFVDMINSSCNFLRTGFSLFLSTRLQKNNKFKYNYGIENLETVSTLFCDTLLIIGSATLMVFAVLKLFQPSEPTDGLIIGVLFKTLCIFVDFYFLRINRNVYKKTNTKLAKSNFEGMLGNTLLDIAVFASVLLTFIFRGHLFVVYVEPIASILIAICIIARAVIRIKGYVKELTYATLDEEDQIKIAAVLAHHFDRYDKFFSVNTHKSGKTVYIDFLLSFPQKTTYGEIVSVLNAITKKLEEMFENCKVSLIFDKNVSQPNDAVNTGINQ